MSWLVSILVALGTAATFGAVMNDLDALGTELHHVVVGLAVVGSLVAWASRKRWLGMVGFTAVKVAAVAALLPGGEWTALIASYPQLRTMPDSLIYFWAVPPALLALSLVEGWALSVIDRGMRWRTTRAWRRRHAIAIVLGLICLGSGLWRLWRADYYLWRLHAEGHGPQSYALRKLGPEVLPRLYEELDALGDEPAGEVRSTLVGIIQDIRYDQVARQRGEVLVTVVATTPAPVDTEMVKHLVEALASEPNDEERRDMTIWLSELDYGMATAVFCEGLAVVPDATVHGMTTIIDEAVSQATKDVYERSDSLYPWRGMDETAIAERKRAILDELQRCVPEALSTRLADCERCDGHTLERGLELVARLGPLTPEQRERIRAVVGATDDQYRAARMLAVVGPRLGEPATTVAEMVGDEAMSASVRWGAVRWLVEQADPAALEKVTCATFPQLTADERLQLLHSEDLPTSDCVVATLQAAFETGIERDANPHALWVYSAKKRLGGRQGVADWAQALIDAHPQSQWRFELGSLTTP